MRRFATTLRDWAAEMPLGRSLFAALHLTAALAPRGSYNRASSLLRAWRAGDRWWASATALRFLERELAPQARLRPLADNPILRQFARSRQASAIRRQFADYDMADRARLRFPIRGSSPQRQGDLILLKTPDPLTGEKGVLLVKYTEAVARMLALFRVERLVERYTIVLEPSWWGYQDALFFALVGGDADVFVQAPAAADYTFIAAHGMGLVPLRLGAGDWIDPETFRPGDGERAYDVVMVSSWNRFKRHTDLFEAMRTAREAHGRVLTAALIGYPSGWTSAHIRARAERYGVADQCTIFESIPQQQVSQIVASSRLYVLLSRREGANKAMYEAMFCDTPVLVPRFHKGINLDHLQRSHRHGVRARAAHGYPPHCSGRWAHLQRAGLGPRAHGLFERHEDPERGTRVTCRRAWPAMVCAHRPQEEPTQPSVCSRRRPPEDGAEVCRPLRLPAKRQVGVRDIHDGRLALPSDRARPARLTAIRLSTYRDALL